MILDEVYKKLVRISIGRESDFSLPGEVDWTKVYGLSVKNGVSSLALDGIKRIYETDPKIVASFYEQSNKPLRLKWYSTMVSLESMNSLQNKRAEELTRIFSDAGFRSCVLKGQGVALLYPEPSLRQPGDIDIWVSPYCSKGNIGQDRISVIEFLKSKWKTEKPVYHHVEAEIFKDVHVEVHYVPAWLYNPFHNRKLQAFFKEQSATQFSNKTVKGFNAPDTYFNLVYSAIHLFKHTFTEDLLFKQLVDYSVILQASTGKERSDAYSLLKSLGLKDYMKWLMWKMKQDCGVPEEYLLCPVPETAPKCSKPFGETVFTTPWRIWHYFWRKRLAHSMGI